MSTGHSENVSPRDVGEQLLLQVRQAADEGHPRTAVRLARKALRLLADTGAENASLVAQLSINLAVNLGELDRRSEIEALLDAAAKTDPDQLPAVRTAKAIHFTGMGNTDRALDEFANAIDGIPPAAGRTLAVALFNRSLLYISMGEIRRAQKDAARTVDVAHDLDNSHFAPMAIHNLGYLEYLSGNLPRALGQMADAASDMPAGNEAIFGLDRAHVLRAAGLYSDALEHAHSAEALLRTDGRPDQHIDALQIVGELHLVLAQLPDARSAFEQAMRIAKKHRNRNLAAIAESGFLRAGLSAETTSEPAQGEPEPPTRQLHRLQVIAETLTRSGLAQDAATALLLRADAQLAGGRIAAAETDLRRARLIFKRPYIGIKLHTRLVAGRIDLAAGRQKDGLAELRKGLNELADFLARFGSQDMQVAAAVHGSELATLGLRTAVRSGSPALILHWLEQGRGVTTRLPAVHPAADAELAELLGALRHAATQEREAAVAGHPDPALRRRVAELRKQVRARSWIVSGSGSAQRPMTLTAVQRLLAAEADPPTIVAYITGQSGVRALAITARRASYTELGKWDDADPQNRRRTADLDLLAASRVPAKLRAVALGSVNRELERLSRLLIDPIAGRLSDGPVVVAVVGELATVPWTLLPGLRGRPVSVTSSVTAAMAASGRPARAHLRGVLAVAGPDVPHGVAEARDIAGLHPGAGLLIEEDATGEAVLAQFPAGGLVHIAAHGTHEPQSPLFSSVLLADGPLYAYDIAPNPQLPDQVVLSSCDVGRSHVRPGGEPLGLAAALLRSGVSTVIAGVSRVSDEVAARVMSAYHRGLLDGESPAAALAGAATADPDEPAAFNCFGSGN